MLICMHVTEDTRLWPPTEDTWDQGRGGSLVHYSVAAEPDTDAGHGFVDFLVVLTAAVACLLCWEGASAWRRMRRRRGAARAGAEAASAPDDADDAFRREEESDILFKLSSSLQL